jgi:8-oxo-dGTP pyrophosphatase MutT (NUDIX family)
MQHMCYRMCVGSQRAPRRAKAGAGNAVASAPRAWHHGPVRSGLLSGYQAAGETEAADLRRMTRLAASAPDPWSRSLPLHFTASALVLHPESRRVLLRWHVRAGLWLQVGGHGDPGESDPLQIALREAREETGLTDLVPWPDASLRHVAVCYVRPSATEPEHEHADLRYFLATANPGAIAPEDEHSPLRWLSLDEARELVGGNNLRRTLDRADALLTP